MFGKKNSIPLPNISKEIQLKKHKKQLSFKHNKTMKKLALFAVALVAISFSCKNTTAQQEAVEAVEETVVETVDTLSANADSLVSEVEEVVVAE